jgi:hypothetical protein
MQAEPGTIKTGDAILNYEWPSTEKELYIRNREELIHLKADANEYVIELHFSNDHSHQYALVFLILLIIVFLALSGMFKFKTR